MSLSSSVPFELINIIEKYVDGSVKKITNHIIFYSRMFTHQYIDWDMIENDISGEINKLYFGVVNYENLYYTLKCIFNIFDTISNNKARIFYTAIKDDIEHWLGYKPHAN